MSSAESVHRREFAWQFLGGLSAASFVAGTAAAEEKLTQDKPAEPPPTEVLVLTALVRNYPGERYDETSLQGIYRDIAGDLARGKQLRGVPLDNADGPATVFHAVRAAAAEGTP